MATATIEAPTPAPATRRRRPAHIDPNAASKRLDRVFRLWADALAAMEAAADAGDALALAMGELTYQESEDLQGEDVAEDAYHSAWAVRTNLSLLESNAPHAVTSLARRAS